MPEHVRKLAHSIDDVTKLTGIGRSFVYEEIKGGRLLVRKAGRRTLIFEADLSAWLKSLPEKSCGTPQHNKLRLKTHK
jgi:excisionase family DNA binding protein